MQTGAVASRVTAAAHARNRVLPALPGQIVVEDLRLRGWRTATSGPTYAAPDATFVIEAFADIGDSIKKDSVYWDLGTHDLGVDSPVTLPDGMTSVASGVSAVALSANEHLVCFYANHFRSSFETGIWTMRVRDDGAGHLYWADPQRVFGSVAVDEVNSSTQLWCSFPRIETIGSEYWIFALECSKYAGHERYHLCYFRSKDGEHWTDRQYLAGASPDAQDQTLGLYQYDDTPGGGTTSTPFTREDLLGAYLVVNGLLVYLLAPGGAAFVTDATALVGVTNPAKTLDLTPYVSGWNLEQSAAPSPASGTTRFVRPPPDLFGLGGDDDILRRGARLTRRAGYRTSAGDELVQLSQEYIDTVQEVEGTPGPGATIQSRDALKLLSDYKADSYYEYDGPQQVRLKNFCDFSSLIVINGSFRINNGARLIAGDIEDGAGTPDNLAYLNFNADTDGVAEIRFKQGVSWEHQYLGIAFNGEDENHYWAVLYNKKNSGKFQLRKVIPNPKKRSQVKLKYLAPVAESDAIELSPGTRYWLRVQVWHGHVQAFYSTDHIAWSKVIDYVSPQDTPGDEVVNADAGSFGVIGKSTLEQAAPLGQTSAKAGPFVLADSGGTQDLAIRVQTDAYRAYLRKIAVLLAQEGNPPPVTIGVLYDADDTGAAPADATDDENIMFAKRIRAEHFQDLQMPQWVGVTVPNGVRIKGSNYVWIWIHSNETPTGDQKWYWFSEEPTENTYGTDLTRTSSDGGATWSSLGDTSQNLAAALIVDYDHGTSRFSEMNAAHGPLPHTLQCVIADVTAKGGILETRTDDLPVGTEVGDVFLTADVVLSGVGSVSLRGASGYRVDLDPSDRTIGFYADSAELGTIESLQYFEAGTSFYLTIVHHKQAIYVYINRCLATVWFDDSILALGYPEVGGDAVWTNVRIPDLFRVQDYFVMEAGTDPASAIAQLVQHRHTNYFVDYAGRLRVSAFRGRTLADTYGETVVQQERGSTDNGWASQEAPEGERYATRWDPDLLDTDGRRYERSDFTDAFSDEDAWLEARLQFVRMRELTATGSLETHGAVPTAEREDRIQDGAGDEWIINDLSLRREPEAFTASIGVRRFVE